MEITSLENFNTITNESGELPVLIDVYAPWCGPCKVLAKTLASFEVDNKDKVSIYKLNIDDLPDLADQLTIQSVPTLMVYKNGQQVGRQSGNMSKDQLTKFVGL